MVRVQAIQCATCIYRPMNRDMLPALEAAIADPKMPGFFTGHRICHHSHTACCRGFWDRHKDHCTIGQLAQRLKCVEFVQDHNRAR